MTANGPTDPNQKTLGPTAFEQFHLPHISKIVARQPVPSYLVSLVFALLAQWLSETWGLFNKHHV